MHPTLRIQLYLLSALALPGLSFFVLAALAAGLLALFRARLPAMLGLAWRARWLFLLLGLGYAYSLPGPAAWPGLGDWSPSWSGVDAASLHMVRLLLLLWLLDVLVVAMGVPGMMSGLHGLFSGLAWLGLPAERTTVRLGLTLQAMERNALRLRDLSALLGEGIEPHADAMTYEIERLSWRWLDSVILMLAMAGLAAAWLG